MSWFRVLPVADAAATTAAAAVAPVARPAASSTAAVVAAAGADADADAAAFRPAAAFVPARRGGGYAVTPSPSPCWRSRQRQHSFRSFGCAVSTTSNSGFVDIAAGWSGNDDSTGEFHFATFVPYCLSPGKTRCRLLPESCVRPRAFAQVLLGMMCGNVVGRRLYRLWSACTRRHQGNSLTGYRKLPGRPT